MANPQWIGTDCVHSWTPSEWSYTYARGLILHRRLTRILCTRCGEVLLLNYATPPAKEPATKPKRGAIRAV